jgi:hypothetical protein
MATGTTQAIPTPRYFGGYDVDDMLSGNDGSLTGLAIGAVAGNVLTEDNRNGLQKFLDSIADIFRGIFKFFMSMFVHDSTEAEVGILSRFQNSPVFDKVDRVLGTDNVGKFVRESAESALRGFVGLTGISKGEAGRVSAIKQSIELRTNIVKFVTKKMEARVPDQATRDKLADDVATSITGITAADVDNFNGSETDSKEEKVANRAKIRPTFGFAKLLIDTGEAAKRDGKYSASEVGEFTIDENLLNSVSGMVSGSVTAAAAAEQARLEALAEKFLKQCKADRIVLNIARLDLNHDGIDKKEAVNGLTDKAITDDAAGYAKFKEQLMRQYG